MTERCIACDKTIVAGDAVYDDVSGGIIHAACCGPERESYVGTDGEPLKPADPIPQPWTWSARSERDDDPYNDQVREFLPRPTDL